MRTTTIVPDGRLRPLLLLAALGLVPACGDDVPDTEPPQVTLLFPGLASAVSSPTVIVRGTASDATGVAVVRVNDMPATTGNGLPTGRPRSRSSPAPTPCASWPRTSSGSAPRSARCPCSAASACGSGPRPWSWTSPRTGRSSSTSACTIWSPWI